jgi:hypothetical protein
VRWERSERWCDQVSHIVVYIFIIVRKARALGIEIVGIYGYSHQVAFSLREKLTV